MKLSLKNNRWWLAAWRYWELLYVLIARNLKVRYRGSFLGVYWSLFNPLIMTALYTAIFGDTFKSYYNNSTINYILAAFTGLIVSHFFSGSTSQALTSVVDNGALLNKISLPVSVFPVSNIGANVFQLCVGMFPLLAIVTLWKTHSLLNVIALIFPLMALVLVCTGIGFLVSALYVFFRDLPFFYELVTFMVWICSPVFYPPEIVPPAIKNLLIFNPLLPIIESVRQISLFNELPDLNLIFRAWMGGLIIVGFGWMCFRWWQKQFMDLL
jgi:ABC-type polysaccharide/polyol phosphate export permease